MIPSDLLYTGDHEWVKVQDGVATVGVTDYAQKALGDIVFVDLPQVHQEFAKGDEAVVVESTKAAASIYAPVAGKVTKVNIDLEDAPGEINRDCYGAGWIYKLAISDQGKLDSLMKADQYQEFLDRQK